jgi:hypothetical protein
MERNYLQSHMDFIMFVNCVSAIGKPVRCIAQGWNEADNRCLYSPHCRHVSNLWCKCPTFHGLWKTWVVEVVLWLFSYNNRIEMFHVLLFKVASLCLMEVLFQCAFLTFMNIRVEEKSTSLWQYWLTRLFNDAVSVSDYMAWVTGW